MKILVVDDDELILMAIKKRLSEDQYTIVTSTNGLDAYKIIQREHLDLIISDIAMPYLSGFELLTFVKKESKKITPIILISSLDQKEIILAAFKSGADDFITKPIDMEELSLKIKGHLILLEGKRQNSRLQDSYVKLAMGEKISQERTN